MTNIIRLKKHCLGFLKMSVDRIARFVVMVAGVTGRAVRLIVQSFPTKCNQRKRANKMNGKTVAAAVVATLVVLVVIKKAGSKIPAAVRNWLP